MSTVDIAGPPDVVVRNAGTTRVFCPVSARAKAWFKQNFPPTGRQWIVGDSLVIETRYAFDLALELRDAGLLCRSE